MGGRLRVAIYLVVFLVVVYGITFTLADRFPELKPRGLTAYEDLAILNRPVDPSASTVPDEVPSPATPVSACDIVTLCLNVVGDWVVWAGGTAWAWIQNAASKAADGLEQMGRILNIATSAAAFDLPAFDDSGFILLRIGLVGVVLIAVGWLIWSFIRAHIPFLPGGG